MSPTLTEALSVADGATETVIIPPFASRVHFFGNGVGVLNVATVSAVLSLFPAGNAVIDINGLLLLNYSNGIPIPRAARYAGIFNNSGVLVQAVLIFELSL